MTERNGVSDHPAIVRMAANMETQCNTLERLEKLISTHDEEIKDELAHYVRVEIFEPVRLVVYGLVGMTLMGVLTAVIALVVKG